MPCPAPPPTTFTHGKNDPAFRTYGDHNTFRAELSDARLPFVMALKRGHGAWQYKDAFRPRAAHSRHPAADLTEVVRLCGLRHWVEQSYKQVKDELG